MSAENYRRPPQQRIPAKQRSRHIPPAGTYPGRPRNPAGLAGKVKRYNLSTRAARNTTMVQALADLPPILISDLIGIQPRTAERFATLAGENWSD